MKIGVLIRPDVANVNYRAVSPVHAVARRGGHEAALVIQQANDSFDLGTLRQCDVVHIYRRADPTIQAAVDDLKRRGIGITWDNDDDIRLLPKESPSYAKIGGAKAERDFKAQIQLLKRAHVVTTTSDYLVDTYRESGARSVVRIENYLNPTQYARAPREHEGLVIGWVAGLEHRTDAKLLGMSEALTRVMERHPEVRVVTIGVRLQLDPERYTHHPVVEFTRLKEHVRQFDVGIAPLADIPMSYARSNVKVKEYAGAGVPWLASARGPYVGLGPQQGGRLVEDGDWEEALEALVASRLLRFRLRRRSQAWGRTQSIERQVGQWLAVLEEARAAARAEGPGRRRLGVNVGDLRAVGG